MGKNKKTPVSSKDSGLGIYKKDTTLVREDLNDPVLVKRIEEESKKFNDHLDSIDDKDDWPSGEMTVKKYSWK